MYCPNCGQQHIVPADPSPNGGELFVAEELAGCIEYYDQAVPYWCTDCYASFYFSPKVEE